MKSLLPFLFFIPFCISAQENNPDTSCYTVTKKDTLYKGTCPSLETMAEFPGGMDSLMKYLKKNIKYPSYSREVGVSGKVHIKFIVEKNGEISNFEVMKGAIPPKGKNEKEQKEFDTAARMLNQEAIRVVSTFPLWQPAIQDGKPVRMVFVLPFSFKLN